MIVLMVSIFHSFLRNDLCSPISTYEFKNGKVSFFIAFDKKDPGFFFKARGTSRRAGWFLFIFDSFFLCGPYFTYGNPGMKVSTFSPDDCLRCMIW